LNTARMIKKNCAGNIKNRKTSF
jgi:hypothetical protein